MIQKITEENGSDEEMQEAVEQALRARFAPELLNRIDEKIVFKTLDQGQIRKIVDLQLESLEKRLTALGWNLEVTESARAAIAEEGFDPQYGARPLKRVIQQRVENSLATELLKTGDSGADKTIIVDFDGERFHLKS